MARSEMTEHSFFALIQKCKLNSVLKIPVTNVYRLITPQPHPEHGRCVASWSFNCVWFVHPTFLNQSQKCFWNCVRNV